MIKLEEMEGSDVESNQSADFQPLSGKTYEELLHSHELAKKFFKQLGELKRTPVFQSLVAYSKQMKFSFKSSKYVMNLMEVRLNKMLKNNKIKKNWCEEDLLILVWLLSKYMEINRVESHQLMTKEDWARVSAMIPGSTPKGCMFKFVSLKKFRLAQHKWQKQQENLLFKLVNEVGVERWKVISERLYELNPKKIYRTAKQCREHWSCYLDPNIKKGPWDRDQDKKLLQLVLESNCQKKWSVIKEYFEGRTQNALKNRYTLLLEKQKKATPHEKQIDLIIQSLKEEKEDTEDQIRKTYKGAAKTINVKPESITPQLPEVININVQYNPSYFIIYNGVNNTDGEFQNICANPWVYQM